MLNPGMRLETAMRQQPVVADRDPLSEDMDAEQHREEADETEKSRKERQQRQQMNPHDRGHIDPIDGVGLGRVWGGKRRGNRAIHPSWERSDPVADTRGRPLALRIGDWSPGRHPRPAFFKAPPQVFPNRYPLTVTPIKPDQA